MAATNGEPRAGTSQRPCPLCKFTTADQKQLESHMFSHVDDPMVCEICGYRSLTHSTMARHMKTHVKSLTRGKNSRRAPNIKREISQGRCPLCKFTCTDKKQLESHMFIHAYPIVCKQCGFRALCQNTMEKHMETHTGEDQSFTTATSSGASNTDMSQHSCPFCGFTTTDQQEMESHRFNHMTYKGKPFMCGECRYRASSMFTLQMHMKTHTDEMDMVCEQYCYNGQGSEPSQDKMAANSELSQDKMAANSEPSQDKNHKMAVDSEPSQNKMAANSEPNQDKNHKMAANSEPSQNKMAANSEPSQDKMAANSEPSQDKMAANSEPNQDKNHKIAANSEPSQNKMAANSEPSQDKMAANSEPSQDKMAANSEPSQNKMVVNSCSEPSQDKMAANSEPSQDKMAANSEPSQDKMAANSEPSQDKMAANSEPSQDKMAANADIETYTSDTAKYISDVCEQHLYGERDKIKSKMLKNVVTSATEKPLRCEECDYRTHVEYLLRKHMICHTLPFMCGECGHRSALKVQMDIHMRTHTGETPYRCEKCGYDAGNKTRLARHMKIHTGGNFACKKCKYTTNLMGDFNQHLRGHEGEKSFKCDVCGLETSTKGSLARHMIIHDHACCECEYRATCKDDLDRHMQTHRLDKKPSRGELFVFAKPLFMCGKCGLQTTNRGALAVHMKIHDP